MWAPSIETQCNVMISSVGRGPSSRIFLHLLNRNWHHIQKHRLVLNLRIEQNPEYFPNTQQLWTLRDFMMVLLPFPYVQFGQFKVCNNKCELKVWKWARMNNSDESGNFLSESFGISLNRTHKHFRQLHYSILDNQTFLETQTVFTKSWMLLEFLQKARSHSKPPSITQLRAAVVVFGKFLLSTFLLLLEFGEN